MILVIKRYKPITPSRRFLTAAIFPDVTYRPSLLFKNEYARPTRAVKFSRGFRGRRHRPCVFTPFVQLRQTQFIVTALLFNRLQHREFSVFKTMYNTEFICRSTTVMAPGALFQAHLDVLSLWTWGYIRYMPLGLVPYVAPLCCLWGNVNQR